MPTSLCSWARRLASLALLLFFAAPLQGASAQDTGAVTVAGGDALTIGGLLQTDAYFGNPRGDAFRARSARLSLGGQAETLQYAVQTDFSSSSILLDAFAQLPLTNRLQVRAGLFKTPFSGEFLTSRPNILFAERARVVDGIAPNRQAGATLTGTLLSDRLSATVGAFNSTRGLRPNDNDLFLYAGRLDGERSLGGGQLEVGTNAAFSIDDNANLSGLDRPSFEGSRFLFGVDARFETDRWLAAGEFDLARLDPRGARDTATPLGFYLTAGATVAEDHQFLARFDQFDPDVPLRPSPDEQLTLGYNYEPSSVLRLQLNYQTPLGGLSDGFFTARLQVALR